jgi:uncharacterized protein (DUF736 family)
MSEQGHTDIGALWEKTSKKGDKYFSGVLKINGNEMKIVVFCNHKKQGPQPDWRIYPHTDNGQKQARETSVINRSEDEIGENEIPF